MAVCYRSCCDISVILLKIKVNSFKVGCFGFFFFVLLVFSAYLWVLWITQKDIFTYIWAVKCCLHIRCVALWGERDHMNIDMGIASDVLDLQNSDRLIHHCINHSHSFFHTLRESGKRSVLCCRHLINMWFHMQLCEFSGQHRRGRRCPQGTGWVTKGCRLKTG